MDRAGAVEAGEKLRDASRQAARRPALQRLARAGFYARAAVYAVIGLLALGLALGRGGRTTDTKGALSEIARAPLGQVALGAAAAGLGALGLWFVLEAIADPERRRGWKGAAGRLGQACAGIGYGWLGFAAVRLLLGARSGPHGDAAARSWTARALAFPAGRGLVAIAGVIVLAVGLKQVWRGLRRRFLDSLELARMGPDLARAARAAGAAGFAAQGAVLALCGGFLLEAAFRASARHARGFDGALAAVASQPSGAALLAALALGLLAYAGFAALEGRYRRMS
jgi:hypothetical protein